MTFQTGQTKWDGGSIKLDYTTNKYKRKTRYPQENNPWLELLKSSKEIQILKKMNQFFFFNFQDVIKISKSEDLDSREIYDYTTKKYK